MWQAEVYVTLKGGVLDPQGEAIRTSLVALGFDSVGEVRVGKYLRVQVDAADAAAAESKVDEMCRRLLANTVIEDYRLAVAPAPAATPAGGGGR